MTDIELYDKAIFDYLKDVHKRVVYAPTDKAEYTITKKNKLPEDKIPYPFISVYRDPNIPIDWNRYSNHTIRGDRTKVFSTSDDKRIVEYIHSIPVTLSYQVDLWGTKSTDILELSQSLYVKLTILNPVLLVPINPDKTEGRFLISDVNLVDNSDIESEDTLGRKYRHTFTFSIDARIKYVRNQTTTLFKGCEVHTSDEGDLYNF